ncbi:MAG: hypothetical protein HYX78_03155 [Armatimonadetes bacterium]|nr:hypothetical protein [Armatimonadota bacterium]
MARQQYQPRKFLRQAPNKLLRRYLEQYDIGMDIKWDDLQEGDIEPIFKAIETASANVQKEIDADFREVFDLADEGGVKTLIEEGHDPRHKIDLAPTFEQMDGLLERALWTFLQHRTIFDVARRLDYADGLTFEKRPYLPQVQCKPDEESTERLRIALSEYYRREEGRGHGCQVDVYARGDRYYYFCSLEDYGRTEQVWDDSHKPKIERQKPTFEIILIYDPVGRSLESKVKGGKRVRTDVERIFGRTVMGVDLGEPPDPGVVYDLSGLLHRDFEFPIKPGDGIDQVCLRRLKLRVMGREYRSITVEVGAKMPEKAIWDLLDETVFKVVKKADEEITEHGIPKELLTVSQAGIRVVFRPDRKGKSATCRVTVSHPKSCSLKCDPKDEIVKTCLKMWKLDVSGRDEYTLPKPGLDAQYRLWPG